MRQRPGYPNLSVTTFSIWAHGSGLGADRFPMGRLGEFTKTGWLLYVRATSISRPRKNEYLFSRNTLLSLSPQNSVQRGPGKKHINKLIIIFEAELQLCSALFEYLHVHGKLSFESCAPKTNFFKGLCGRAQNREGIRRTRALQMQARRKKQTFIDKRYMKPERNY